MNRNQQTHMGPSDACYYADHRGCPFPTMCECSCHKSLAGDSTPPATPVKTPEEMEGVQEMREHLGLVFDALWRGQFDQIAQRRAADQHVGPVLKWLDTRWPPTRVRRPSHTPAVSGEGEQQCKRAWNCIKGDAREGDCETEGGRMTRIVRDSIAHLTWLSPVERALVIENAASAVLYAEQDRRRASTPTGAPR